MSVDLSTTYLGMKLRNPLVVAACSLTHKIDVLKRLEDAGAAAAVMPSLFEEQIVHDDVALSELQDYGTESFAEALSYFPQPEHYHTGPEAYLKTIEDAKQAISIPIIASLNGTSDGGWIRYAKLMQDAGADAIELNVYYVPTDLDKTGAEVEKQYVDLVAAVKQSVSIPLAVKVGPYFSAMANMAKRLADAGADGLVLFNRFLQPDVDLDLLEAYPKLVLSTSHELLAPLRWIAILHGRLDVSLALTGGLHDERDMIKSLLAGADVAMVASLLYQQGVDQIGAILNGLTDWMQQKDYVSVEQLKGSMSQAKCPDPDAFARGNYMKVLTSFTGEFT